MIEIEDFLRENKPSVKEDPTFILETGRRLEQVEGIKTEVDRQRRHGRVALIAALAAGLAVGVLATAVAFLYPVDTEAIGESIFGGVRLFMHTYRQYLLLPVAFLAITLGTILSRKGVNAG